MPATIISDTSCLILLEKIDALDLLQKMFGVVFTTSVVQAEFGAPFPEWVQVRNPSDSKMATVLAASLDKGEASAIALALEQEQSLLIMDELKGRKLALQLGLSITGTLGIIVQAKLSGHIPSVRTVLAQIKATNFRIGEQLERALLHAAGE